MIRKLPWIPGARSSEPPGSRGDLTLLLAHLKAAQNLACWLMRNQTEAEDMVQDAYLLAIRHFAGFRGGDGRAWLLKIVRNTCYNRLRQNGVFNQDAAFDEALHSAGPENSDPETALLSTERGQLLRKMLAELPTEYREVLILRELEELSYREIASIAGIPIGTVMSRLSRARRQLQQSLELMEPTPVQTRSTSSSRE